LAERSADVIERAMAARASDEEVGVGWNSLVVERVVGQNTRPSAREGVPLVPTARKNKQKHCTTRDLARSKLELKQRLSR
jgi:hypothetical protein